ncbi:MAG: thiol-disulfide oxidoreductase DCC family protein [Saprospiraceae bacterium]|nr:thiol-disulfide oxidoreductase DCC family protein [Saprospiraceae bacterium]
MSDPVLLFDGVCNLCSASVQWVLLHDKKEAIRFASLQSEAGRRLMVQHGLDPAQMSSVVLIEQGRCWTMSDAPLRVLAIVGGWWRIFSVFSIVPKPVRDSIYAYIARHRYRWFGKKQECWLPKESWKRRFLDF